MSHEDSPADTKKVARIMATHAEWLTERGCIEGAELLYRFAERVLELPSPITFDAEGPPDET